ncbi:transcriptional regulator GcvA [Variovorax sp. PBL-E5]|uniref:transcriptional regulator GcvA n=1 Tax=Variovorax sp. PBL-E5 TaxID=434014 RepID=UPI0013198E33|nr:transcriptional regulator GcvA [Variovorax sp. PBL-E5]VTU37547.1 Gcv operon activator [Variovorax sp. PBL-E5]
MPPLNALRAFVSTARHLSATKAAVELHVTLGAVSHQLRALEEFLGVDLFVRGHRKLTLTDAGERYFREVSVAFDSIRAATTALVEPGNRDMLKLRAYTTFSLRWLIPRLSSFYAENRSVELVLSTSNEPVDFSREKLDFAIRLGNGEWPGSIAERLIPNIVAPVCSPSLLARGPEVSKPIDLMRHVLLQSTWPERRDDWPTWLAEQGVATLDDFSFLYFESSALSYQAAIEGQGFVMAQMALVQDDIAAGRLVCPFDRCLDRGDFTYYLIYPEGRRLTSQMETFRQWLRAQCAAFNEAPSSLPSA